jgi:transposase
MTAAVSLRDDYTSDQLRHLSCRSKDAKQARRLLAMADILEGMGRAEAGRRAGVSIQTVRDWVLRFNEEGPDGLVDRKSPGRPPKLTPGQQDELKEIINKGPDIKTDGVVRWRCKDLRRLIKQRFKVDLDERNVGRLVRRLGFSYVSARPRHPKQDPQAIEDYKKTSLPAWQKS